MNKSWLSNSSSSPGFVYFKVDTTPANEKPETESSDFIPFSDNSPSPQANRFNPTNYSSPQNYRRGSPRNFCKRGWKQNYGNTSHSPNTSYNSSSNSPRNRIRQNNYHNNSKSFNGSFNKVTYLSFLEDPWAYLEKQLEEKRKNECSKLGQSSHLADSDIVQKTEQIT